MLKTATQPKVVENWKRSFMESYEIWKAEEITISALPK